MKVLHGVHSSIYVMASNTKALAGEAIPANDDSPNDYPSGDSTYLVESSTERARGDEVVGSCKCTAVIRVYPLTGTR
jgi:hypothetical protein